MKNMISLLSLSALASSVMAHGTHDHSMILATGAFHPMGVEHGMLLAAIAGAVYLSVKFLRK